MVTLKLATHTSYRCTLGSCRKKIPARDVDIRHRGAGFSRAGGRDMERWYVASCPLQPPRAVRRAPRCRACSLCALTCAWPRPPAAARATATAATSVRPAPHRSAWCARGVCVRARRLQARALDSMRARGRCARTQAPAVAGSSVLGEVPPNRVDKLPVILYRALQPPDMDQVCGVPPGIAPQPSRRARLDIR